MSIDISDAPSHESVPINEEKDLPIHRESRRWKSGKEAQHFVSVFEISAGQLANDKGMGHHFFVFERIGERSRALPQVINPDGGVDQDHDDRRRRGALARRSLPPRRASLLALSRAMSARRPS